MNKNCIARFLRDVKETITYKSDWYAQDTLDSEEKEIIQRIKKHLMNEIEQVEQDNDEYNENEDLETTMQTHPILEKPDEEYSEEKPLADDEMESHQKAVDRAMEIFANRILREIEYIGNEEYLSLAAREAFRNIQEALKEFTPKQKTHLYRINYEVDSDTYYLLVLFDNDVPIRASKVYTSLQEAWSEKQHFDNNKDSLFFFRVLPTQFLFIQSD